jgi:dienelactone hydrolase
MINKINLQIPNSSGFEIDIDCRFKKSEGSLPVIFFCHGFKGFKDWGGFPHLMEQLALEGYFAVSFNFSHNGVSKTSPMDFSRLDLFAQNTFSIELDDLKTVIGYFYKNAARYKIDTGRIGLMGHSRGGGTAILYASADKRIKALVTLASVSGFNRYGKEHKKMWKEKGYFEIENARTKQMMRLNITLLDDLEINKEKLDVSGAASKIEIPWLIIHGREDLAVKYTEAEELYKTASKAVTQLLLLENAGHTFGVVHPYEGTTKAFEKVIEEIKNFLSVNL